ncbi:MAG: type I secretion C-terminal target domain-containing protein, partial [Burkholderiales bacterium]|nr:type I secretion C-terminal target domain-containing protein [Burkholderiales bacterium]
GDSDPDGTTPTIKSINGIALTPGIAQTILVTGGTVNITAANIISFTPSPNFNGQVSIQYVITDGLLTSNANEIITVTAVNDAPLGIDRAVTTGEDTPYHFSIADFRMNDVEDGSNSTPTAIRIDTLPGNGVLQLNGVTVIAGQILLSTELSGLTFTPAANANGASYANFTFSVRDSGNLYDTIPNTLSIAVSPRVDLSVQDVQHWTFNEGVGTTTTNIYPTPDQIGTRTDGIAGGVDRSPTFTANGHEGFGMQFNGIWSNTSGARDGGYLALPTSVTDPLRGNGSGGGSASLVFWLNTTQTGGSIGWNSPSVIGMENNGGTTDIQWGWLDSTGRIGFGMADTLGFQSINPINDGKWHHVAMNHNFTTGATEVWVDGVLNSSGNILPGAIMPNKFLGFGVTADDGAATDRYLNGTLDDARIYDRTLTGAQIKAIYAVESNNLGANAVLDNDGGSVRFALVGNDYTHIEVTGAPIGATFSDGVGGHSVTTTSVGQIVDLTGWTQAELAVGNLGTNSALLAVTATGATAGDSVTQFVNIVTDTTVFNGSNSNETLTGTAGADFISGMGGNDTINAGNGDDRVFGGSGDDIILGGAGKDVLVGGVGNDTLTGGTEADTFRWSLGDAGTTTLPANDRVTDFDPAAFSAGGDRLDLRDLLQGENHASGNGNLGDYLHFVKTGNDTVVHISSTGGFAGGFSAAKDDQVITLSNVLLTGADDAAIINDLLAKGKLIVD